MMFSVGKNTWVYSLQQVHQGALLFQPTYHSKTWRRREEVELSTTRSVFVSSLCKIMAQYSYPI